MRGHRITISACLWLLSGTLAHLCLGGCAGPTTLTVRSALEKAQQTNRLVLVEFWSAFSRDCFRMDTDVLTDPLIKEDLGDFVRVRVDFGLRRNFAQRCGVAGAPGFATLRPDGSLIASHTGFLDRDAFQRFLIRSKVFR